MGTRLRPLTDTIPKCLVPIGGRPLLSYWLETLIDAGMIDILINTHFLSEQIETFVNDCKYKQHITLVHEQNLLNTGGSLLQNRVFFDDESIMIIHADNFSICNYKKFIKAHEQRPKGTIGTMMTFITNLPESCGIVDLNADGVVIDFFEKIKNPPSNLANGAVYIFEPEIFDYLKRVQKQLKTKKIDISNDIIPKLMGKIFTFHNDQCHIDIGTVKNYQLACDYASSTANNAK